jgi:FKBP-type peptidyl-prolyl cis-trans isomerase
VFDVTAGTGATPTVTDKVSVRFTGFLQDGCIFTTSYLQEEPVEIDLTASIEGIREGVSTMQAGGNRRLRIPATLAYGAQGFPGRVPANSPVVFVIELGGIVDRSSTGTPPAVTTTPAAP